ncbi:MAG TPA: Lpg1974 family pore-forming outer membrane protein [Pirellulales bacterium]|nr:Lpg1974 family pore-forming outer membrane protein [Pirellulales bacterium]
MRNFIWKTAAALAIGWMATPAAAQQSASRIVAPPFQVEQAPVATPASLAGYRYGYVGVPTAYRANAQAAQETYVGYLVEEEPAAAAGDVANPIDATAKSGSCGSCGAAAGCNTGCNTCCDPFWAHRSGAFFDFLYLRPRNADVAYALPRNGVDPATAVPYGAVATANPNFGAGFRLGSTYAIDRCSSLQLTYTYFQSNANGSAFTNPPLSMHSLVTDPHTYTAASDSLASLSRYHIGFQLVDLDYRRLIAAGNNWSVNYAVGTRYAHLSQLFRESQPIGPGQTNVGSNINFDGAGARAGLMGKRKAANSGLMMYGKGFVDILAGNFRSNYLQVNNFQQTQVWTSWKDFRPVPILEFELGAGWQSADGRFQFRGGYYFASWFNTVSTSNYVQAVQTNNYVNIGNAITFDGLVLRGQYNW